MSETAVIDFGVKQLSLFGEGNFKFKRDNTVVYVDKIVTSQQYVNVTGKLVRMIEVLDFDDTELYTREQFENLGLRRDFDSFEKEYVETWTVGKGFPWFRKETIEKAVVPDGFYGCPEDERQDVEIKIPKDEFVIFDYRKKDK